MVFVSDGKHVSTAHYTYRNLNPNSHGIEGADDEFISLFLQLPAEIRLCIYDFVFAPLSSYVQSDGTIPASALPTSSRLSLLLTCRLIHLEARILAFRTHTFTLYRSYESLPSRLPLDSLSNCPNVYDNISSLFIPFYSMGRMCSQPNYARTRDARILSMIQGESPVARFKAPNCRIMYYYFNTLFLLIGRMRLLKSIILFTRLNPRYLDGDVLQVQYGFALEDVVTIDKPFEEGGTVSKYVLRVREEESNDEEVLVEQGRRVEVLACQLWEPEYVSPNLCHVSQ